MTPAGEAGWTGLEKGALLGPILLLAILCARLGTPFVLSAHAHVFVAQELALVVAAAILSGVAVRSRLRPAGDAVAFVIAALVVTELASVACARDAWLAIRSATVWIAGLAVFVVARARSGDAAARELGLRGLLLPLGIAALSVLLEALGIVRLSASHHAPGGLLGERNVAAELLVVGAPVALHVAVEDARRSQRFLALAVLALSTAALVLTRTRSAWLAGLVAVGCLFWFGRRSTSDRSPVVGRHPRAALAVVFGITLALALPTKLHWRGAHPYRETLVHLVDRSTPSASGRLVQYATTARMALAHPVVGVGPGNWAAQYLSFAEPNDPTVHAALSPVNRLPNSDLFGFAAERGLLAFALLAALGVLLLRQSGPSPSLQRLRRVGMVAVAVVASLDAVLQTPAALFLVAWQLGLSSAPSEARVFSWPVPTRAFAAASVVLSIAAVPAGARLAALDRAAHARGSEDLERATKLDPGDIALRLFTAESWIADGRCDRAQAHLAAVARFSPSSPARAELEARCVDSDVVTSRSRHRSADEPRPGIHLR